MDWISGIQNAVNYIERNLTGEIDLKTAAREACSSVFHFQRVFSIFCGFTVGDYIRMRRLSEAASELSGSDCKVIDIALKYGYDSPESFTRAFVRFHGVTPSVAKRGGTVRSFSRISVKLIISGGSTMDYRIERLEDIRIICRREKVSKHEMPTATADISLFWDECNNNGTAGKLVKYIPEQPRLKGLLGICFAEDMQADEFPYGIGAEYDGRPVYDKEFEIVDIPANTYAVFVCKGKMPDAFSETYKKIISEFFPQNSKYEYGHGVELEVYPSDNVNDPDYICEIWIAVNEK